MPLSIKRAYEPASPDDGYRILVDRLWPRGIAKEAAKLDEWSRDLAPSDSLRRSLHAGQVSWDEFQREYRNELEPRQDALLAIASRARRRRVTLLFGARDEKRNNAVVLKEILESLIRQQSR